MGVEMAKMKCGAAMDLFDLGAASQPGGRQMDIEELIAEQESLLSRMDRKDEAAVEDWMAQAKAGVVMRIC